MKVMGRYRLAGALLLLMTFFCGQNLWAQGEINVRLTNGTGPSIFTGCRDYLGVFDISPQTVTLHIENKSTTENLTLTGFQNIFNSGEMNVSITGNTCGALPVTLNPGQNCQITLTLNPLISAVMEDTLNINNSDVDEGLYQIFISLTTLDPRMDGKVLILNEVSQGDAGVREYVEFLVVGRPGTCQDVRGWLFDDNSGRPGGPGICGSGPSGAGIATGHARLSQDPQWENIPVGSLIVVYNPADRNTRMPADDPTDSSPKDDVFIIPITNSTLLDKYPTCPTATGAGCNDYSCAVGSNNIWDFLGMANGGDLFQLIDPAHLDTFSHSVSWGSLPNTISTIFFSGNAAQKTIQFVNTVSDDAFQQANWRYENVANALPNGDTPGLPNSTKNQRWLESVRFKTYGCVNNRSMTPSPNDSCVVFFSTNATENVTGYEWDFDNDGTVDRTTTTPYTNFSYNSNGSYTIKVRLVTGTPCSQFQTVTLDCFTFAKYSEIFYVRYDATRKGAVLNWATDNPKAETHVVERSIDGTTFVPIYEVKTTEKANVHQLQYIDTQVPIMADKVYYRIRYRETTGATQTLPIRELRLNRPDLLTLAPNPTMADLNVSAPETIQACTVIDATGRTVFTYQAPDNKGLVTLTTETLPEGVYWLLVQTAQNTYYDRWVKM